MIRGVRPRNSFWEELNFILRRESGEKFSNQLTLRLFSGGTSRESFGLQLFLKLKAIQIQKILKIKYNDFY